MIVFLYKVLSNILALCCCSVTIKILDSNWFFIPKTKKEVSKAFELMCASRSLSVAQTLSFLSCLYVSLSHIFVPSACVEGPVFSFVCVLPFLLLFFFFLGWDVPEARQYADGHPLEWSLADLQNKKDVSLKAARGHCNWGGGGIA